MTTATSRRSSSEGTRETQRMKEMAGHTGISRPAVVVEASFVRILRHRSRARFKASPRGRPARACGDADERVPGGWGAVSERAPARRRDRVPRARGALARARRFPAPPPPLPRRRLASPDADPASIRPPPRPRAARLLLPAGPRDGGRRGSARAGGGVRVRVRRRHRRLLQGGEHGPGGRHALAGARRTNARARSDRRALADRVVLPPHVSRAHHRPPLPPPYLDPSRAPQTPRPRAELFCNLCAYNVARGSKHCRACDKCVLHFDHHCKWLNNCVGSKNYHSFFLLVSTVLFQVLAQMAAGAYLLRWALVDKADASASLADVDRFPLRASVNHQEFVVFLVAYLFAGVCLGYLVGDLFVFHLVLMRRGITTFDYITSQREKKAEEGSSSRDGGGGGGSEEEDEFDDQSFSDATAAKGGAVCADCRGVASRRVNPGEDGRVDRRKRRSSGARVGLSCWALAFADVEAARRGGGASRRGDGRDGRAAGVQPGSGDRTARGLIGSAGPGVMGTGAVASRARGTWRSGIAAAAAAGAAAAENRAPSSRARTRVENDGTAALPAPGRAARGPQTPRPHPSGVSVEAGVVGGLSSGGWVGSSKVLREGRLEMCRGRRSSIGPAPADDDQTPRARSSPANHDAPARARANPIADIAHACAHTRARARRG